MFKGSVTFVASIKGNGLTFPKLEFVPQGTAIEKVDIEGPNGSEIRSTIYLSSVASPEVGKTLAASVNKAALDRITFKHGTAIDDARVTAVDFSPMNPEPNVLYAGVGSYAIFGCSASLTVGVDPANLKIELERPTREGERYYGLYRSARQSASPIEEFMHLYNILLMLFNDKQSEVDSFIVKHEPAVPQTQNPIKKPGLMETIYTRLRNEFAHKRDQVDLVITKKEMVDRLGGLVDLVRRAIELAQ